jgi:hypothetical protein
MPLRFGLAEVVSGASTVLCGAHEPTSNDERSRSRVRRMKAHKNTGYARSPTSQAVQGFALFAASFAMNPRM